MKKLSSFFLLLIIMFIFSAKISFAACVAAPNSEQFCFLGQLIDPAPKNGVNSFISVGVAVANYILGITGSLALLAFIWGGFKMLISRGESKSVQEGKDAIKAAVIGMFIVFASYSIIQFVLASSGLINNDGSFKNQTDFKGEWKTTPGSSDSGGATPTRCRDGEQEVYDDAGNLKACI